MPLSLFSESRQAAVHDGRASVTFGVSLEDLWCTKFWIKFTDIKHCWKMPEYCSIVFRKQVCNSNTAPAIL